MWTYVKGDCLTVGDRILPGHRMVPASPTAHAGKVSMISMSLKSKNEV